MTPYTTFNATAAAPTPIVTGSYLDYVKSMMDRIAEDLGIPKGIIGSAQIITNEFLRGPRVQVRFPRSKKVRIRKKWAKNPKNWNHTEDAQVYEIGGVYYMHPKTLEKLERNL